jgi:hypothetical protein
MNVLVKLSNFLIARKLLIGFRWFMKIKCYADGTLDCYKARHIAQGYSQHPGFDFHKTFAPTV